MNIPLISGQLAKLHVKLETEDDFELYGGTTKAGFSITSERPEAKNEWLVTIDELEVAGKPLTRFDVYARQVSSGREWVVLSGKLLVSPRSAGVDADKLAPIEYNVSIPVVENAVDLTGAAIVTGIPGPRGYSAYEIAVLEGFEGTEAEWLESMRQQTATLAVEQVTPLVEQAEKAAQEAENARKNAGLQVTAAREQASAACDYATEAEKQAMMAEDSRIQAAREVDKAAAEVKKAAAEVNKATQEREAAAGHADKAEKSAQAALANQQSAEQAAQDAALAQVGAEQAKTDAAASSQTATQKATEAADSATQAAADKAAAEQAKTDAQTAQSKAEQEAARSEQNAAMLGDAALQSGDNTFTGSNVFNGTLSGNGTFYGMPFGAAFGGASMYQGLQLSAEEFMRLFPNYAEMEVWPGLDGLSTDMNNKSMPKLKYVYSQLTRDYYVSVPAGMPKNNLKEIVLYHSGNGWVQAGMNAIAERNVFILPSYNNIKYGGGHLFMLQCSQMSDTFIYAPKLSAIRLRMGTSASPKIIFLGSQVYEGISFDASDHKHVTVTLKGFNSSKCVSVKITSCALDKSSILELVRALPTYDGTTMTAIPTCELYIDPVLQGDEEVEAALLNLQAAVEDGGKGWTVAVTGITLGGAATFALRTMHYYARRENADGTYIDADGQRWDISGGTTVLRNYVANEQLPDYTAFPALEDALETWGLHEITPEESKADYERRHGKIA